MAGAKLADALDKCSALQDVPASRRSEPAEEAWEALRTAFGAARKEPEALDLPVREEEAMADALELLAKTWHDRKVLRARALECLSAAMVRDAWARAAQRRPGLPEALLEPLADRPELLERLHASIPVKAGVKPEPRRAPLRPTAEVQAEFRAVRDSLLKGRNTMESFDWQFPVDFGSTKLDTATEAFMDFYAGLTRLGVVLKQDDPPPDLGLKSHDWPGVLSFLTSMYSCPSRRSYRPRVKFVASRLQELSPGFADAQSEMGSSTPFWLVDGADDAPTAIAQEDRVEDPAADVEEVNPSVPEVDSSTGSAPAANSPSRGGGQKGRLVMHNGTKQELVFYVEETEKEWRVPPDREAELELGGPTAHVRVNFVGLLGFTSLRTRLARERLEQQNYYTVVRDRNGDTQVKAVH